MYVADVQLGPPLSSYRFHVAVSPQQLLEASSEAYASALRHAYAPAGPPQGQVPQKCLRVRCLE
jgi:hypothetical protein